MPVAPKKKSSKLGALVAITVASGVVYTGFTRKDEIVEDFSPPPKEPEVIVVEEKPTPVVVVKPEPKPTPPVQDPQIVWIFKQRELLEKDLSDFDSFYEYTNEETNERYRAEAFQGCVAVLKAHLELDEDDKAIYWEDLASIATGYSEQVQVVDAMVSQKATWAFDVLSYFEEDGATERLRFRATKAKVALKDRIKTSPDWVIEGEEEEPVAEKPKLTAQQRFDIALKEYKDTVDKNVEKLGLSVWCPSVAEFQGLSQPQREVLPLMKYVSGTEEAKKLRASLEKKHNLESKIYHAVQYQLWKNVKDRCRAIAKYSRQGVLLEYHFGELKNDWDATKKPILENWSFLKDVSFMWENALFTGTPQVVSGNNGENIVERRTLYIPYVVMKDNDMATKGQYAVAEFQILLGEEGIEFEDMSPGRGQLFRGRGVMTHVDVLGYILESHQ